MSLEDHYGDILQKARTGTGLSVADLARRSGLSLRRLHSLEAGETDPPHDEVRRLAELLGLEPSRLLSIAGEQWRPEPLRNGPSACVKRIAGSLGGYAVNSYLFCDDETGEAVAIDTANAPEKVLDEVRSARLKLTTIMLTHTHPDHVGGVDRLQQTSGARFVAHPLDQQTLGSLWDADRDQLATEGSVISCGRENISVLWVPGHTHSGVCYAGAGVVFVGDCLFAGSVGRAPSPAAYRQLLEAIQRRLLALTAETIIYPGHGPPTTVGEERRHNPFFPKTRVLGSGL